jgi:5-methylcytosine-specific restriction protein A
MATSAGTAFVELGLPLGDSVALLANLNTPSPRVLPNRSDTPTTWALPNRFRSGTTRATDSIESRPMADLNVCTTPGCPNLTRSRYCTACAAPARQVSDTRRPTARQRGYDRQWEKIRAHHLREHPDCAVPGCPNPATEVDHVVPITEGGTHHAGNLRSMCHPHHSSRTARDQPGGFQKQCPGDPTGWAPPPGGCRGDRRRDAD